MIRAVNVRHQGGQMRFTAECRQNGTPKDLDITLNLAGMHNVLNALAAIAVALEICVADDAIIAALAEFEGVDRRFQRYGEIALPGGGSFTLRSEEHTSELQSQFHLVCR